MTFNRTPLGLKAPSPVSQRIRDFARGQECTLRLPCCNHDTATTSHCHLRFFGWAGVAQKPADFLGVHACSACHDALDRRNNAGAPEWEHEDVLRALGETQLRLFRAGLIKI